MKYLHQSSIHMNKSDASQYGTNKGSINIGLSNWTFIIQVDMEFTLLILTSMSVGFIITSQQIKMIQYRVKGSIHTTENLKVYYATILV